MSDCIFCKIKDGEIPSAKVYEDDIVYAFLDTSQVTPGHTLVIPKEHVKDILEYNSELAGKVFERIPKISQAIKDAFPEVAGLNIVNNNGELAYQSVFHSHIHIIPRYTENDTFSMTFGDNANSYSQDEFQDKAKAISNHIK